MAVGPTQAKTLKGAIMKKAKKTGIQRAAACALTLCMTLLVLPQSSRAAANYSYSRTDTISHGLSLTLEQTKDAAGRGGQAYIYDYTPGDSTRAIVAYGDKLYGKSTVDQVVSYCEKQGYTVMAAFNADFFSMATGIPTGLVVREGRLCSSDGAWNAVGFRDDGSVIVGAPKLDITFSVNGGQRFAVAGFNKVRDASGIFLYSGDYGDSTYLTAEGPVAVLRKVQTEDELSIGGSIALRVVEAGMSSGASRLDEDRFVLTCQKAASVGIDLTALQAGDLVTVYTGTRSTGWEDVVYACGAGDLLAVNGSPTAAASASSVRGPRTMLGVRRDGSLSVLVCDGRSGGTADGMTLLEGAQRLLDAGCVTVVNLDGGGSSVASARYPGYENSGIVSQPSDGTPRKCATYIVFVNDGRAGGSEYAASVYPKGALVLAGGTIELEARSYNRDYFPMQVYDSGFYIDSGEGSIDGSLLTVSETGGEISVGIAGAGRSDNAVITSVDRPETMTVVRKGSAASLSKLTLDGGETADLDVIVTDGLRQILSSDTQFDFAVSGNIGTIDAQGRFTAADVQGVSGAITVSFGDLSRTVSVTVGQAPETICDFETGMTFAASAVEGGGASAAVSLTPDNTRYGKGSLGLSAWAGENGGTAVFTVGSAMRLQTGMRQMTLMVKGSGWWSVDFNTASGVVSRALTLTDGGWTFNTVDIPSGALSVAGFRCELEAGEQAGAYIDQMTGHYGAARRDMTPPEITLLSSDYDFQLRVTDDGIYPLEKSQLTIRLDGAAYTDYTFDEISGLLDVTVPQDGAVHKLTVEAVDWFGNRARYIGETAGTVSGPFGDLAGHWAEDEINYLYIHGVFTADSAFRPQSSCTNEMVATMISRYMGIDTSKYDDVVLPYADGDKIHDWALPHVRALYALGIMQGGSDNAGNIWFYPTDGAVRARVMTVLGRTIARGYAYGPAGYSDFQSVPGWAQDHISLLTHLGIVNGYGGGNEVRANAGITRAEIAALLYRLY